MFDDLNGIEFSRLEVKSLYADITAALDLVRDGSTDWSKEQASLILTVVAERLHKSLLLPGSPPPC